MRFLALGFVLTLQVSCAALAGGCGSTERPAGVLPACSDIDWLGRGDHAQLTGEPTFSALELTPGEPLSIAVPVDVNTRTVRIFVASLEVSSVGSGGSAETDGGEIVDIPINDTNLPAGVYVANQISLEGERGDAQSTDYISDREVDATYRLSVLGSGDFLDRCVTELTAPTFIVLNGGSDEP